MEISNKTSSFAVARTNPKLTGNVKISVDSGDNIWLNSFDANKELSQDRFKRFPIEDTSNYEVDLYKFFDGGETPSEIVFDLQQSFPNPDAISLDFEDQYDFFYAMGAQSNISNQFVEEYSYLAPLWLREDLPEFFVIYRIKDPLDFPYNKNVVSGAIQEKTSYKVVGEGFTLNYNNQILGDGEIFKGVAGKTEYTILTGEGKVIDLNENKDFPIDVGTQFEDIIDQLELVKTFDLTDNSKIGKYIRRLTNSPRFPKSPMNVRFEEELLTQYNGISYQEGTLTTKGEFLDDVWQNGRSIIDFEEFITGGFERQGIICANLLNLEFLFDDDTADLYDIPRYLGFYVGKNDIGSFQLSGNDLFGFRNEAGNNEKPKRNDRGYADQEVDFFQTNENGVQLFIQNTEGTIPNSDEVKQDLRSFYIQDKNGDFYTLSRLTDYGSDLRFDDLIVRNQSLNLADFTGQGSVKLQGSGELTDTAGKSYAVIKIIGELFPNDSIRIYWPPGALVDSPNVNGQFSEIVANDLTGPLGAEEWGPGSNLEDKYFHPLGTVNEIATAIAATINEIEGINFTAFAIEDEVVIRLDGSGTFANTRYSIAGNFTFPDRVLFQREEVTNDELVKFEGGTDVDNIRIIKIPIETAERLTTDDYIRTDRGLSRIALIGRFVDREDLDEFNTFSALFIEDVLHEPLIGNTKNFTAIELFRANLGLFTFFNVKEIDGDFLNSTYGRSYDGELHKYFDLKPNDSVLEVATCYLVLGEGKIKYNGVEFPSPAPVLFSPATNDDNRLFTRETSSDPDFFEVVEGNPIVVSSKYFSINLNAIPIFNVYNASSETGEFTINENLEAFDKGLADFEGFQTLKEISLVEDELALPEDTDLQFRFRDKFIFKNIDSEYDFLKENSTKERSIKSKLVPFINKWVFQGGRDVRDNPYRLNTSLAFGELNFSPSFDVRKQDPSAFTHEWYYLDSFPRFYPDEFIESSFSYFKDRFDRDSLVNIDPDVDYFTDYFTVDEDDLTESNALQERFSILDFNSETGFVEGLFRGVKVRIKETIKGESTETLPDGRPQFIDNSNKFDGYKFSAILTIKKPDTSLIENPINIEVIEDKTHKNITFLIELTISDYRINVHEDSSVETIIEFPLTGFPSDTNFENDIFEEQKLDYLSLYSMKDQKRLELPSGPASTACIFHEIDDTKLNIGLNLSFPGGTSTRFGDNWIVFPFDNTEYDWDLREEIHSLGAENIFVTENVFNHRIETPFPTVIEEDKIYLNKDASPPPDKFINLTTSTEFIIPFSSPNTWRDNPVFQISGGKLFLEPILEKISLSEIANKINSFSRFIKYKSFEAVGNTVVETENEFYLEFLKPTSIQKMETLRSVIDQEKPEQFTTVSTIGFNLEPIAMGDQLLRYSGPYEPKFRDLVFFGNQKTDALSLTPEIDLKFHQTKFNPNITDFGIMKGLGFLKVGEKDILALTDNDKFDSLYPLIDEVPVTTKDLYIFQSNWDPGFYQLHNTRSNFVPRAGTREMKELKNFFGSKIMKTRASLRIEEFTVQQVATIENINLDLVETEIVFEDQENRIRGLLILDKALVRFLREDGADAVFKENILSDFGTGDTLTLDDDIEEYLRDNILPVYQINDLVLFSKKDFEIKPFQEFGTEGDPTSTGSTGEVIGDLTDVEKISNGFIVNKDFTATNFDKFLFSFEIEKDNSFNITLAFSAVLGKI